MKNLYNVIWNLSISGSSQTTPKSLIDEILDNIDTKTWSDKNIRILDPVCGIGMFYLCCLERFFFGLEEVIPDKRERLLHIVENQLYAIDIDQNQIRKLKKSICLLGLYNSSDISYNIIINNSLNYDWQNMKFDYIVGNPPYQKGKDKKFYQKFIDKNLKNLTENGELIFINPATFFNKDANKLLDSSPEFIVFKNSDEAFQGQISTTDVCYWKYKNSEKDNQKVTIQDETNSIKDLEISWPIPNNFPALGYENQRKLYKDLEKTNSILEKLCKVKSKPGKGQNEFVDSKTNTHAYEVYLSSKKDRQSLWSKEKPIDYEDTKLIIAHIIECKDVDRYTEIVSNKGVGRYARYFLGDKNELNNVIAYFKSDAYKFVDKFKRRGRYAEISIPKTDWTKPFCLKNILSKDEIKILRNYLV
jgi:hypothetical protein